MHLVPSVVVVASSSARSTSAPLVHCLGPRVMAVCSAAPLQWRGSLPKSACLADLKERGLLIEEEFTARKRQILGL